MKAELERCIASAQRAINFLGISAPADDSYRRTARTLSSVANLAASGIPLIEDSRIPKTVNLKLRALTEDYFRRACGLLQNDHPHRDAASLRVLALQLKATYTDMYERKLLEAVGLFSKSKPRVPQKQPFANDILLYAFEKSQSPTRHEREVLASLTGMTLEQVRVWFQNRRSRSKRKAPELQPRTSLQLSDVLDRVRATHQVCTLSKQSEEQEYDDDNDSGYCSELAASHTLRQQTSSLCPVAVTPRSYPAAYVPQPLASRVSFDPPNWPRVSSSEPRPQRSTVTIDELSHFMGRLTLRHRRPSTRHSEPNPCVEQTVNSALAMSAAKKGVRKDLETGRKVTGRRRHVPTEPSTYPTPPVVSSTIPSAPMSVTRVPPVVSGTPSQGRKKAGLPRRQPAGKTLSRQISDISISSASSTSSHSSRSTSYASDFSFGSAASDLSSTSIESSSPIAASPSPNTEMLGSPMQLHPQTHPGVPTFDFSLMSFDTASAAEPPTDLTTLLSDTTMLQLLEAAQPQEHQYSTNAFTHNVDSVLPLDQQLDVGVANMDVLVDFGSAAYTSLDALLTVDISPFSAPFMQQTTSCSPHLAPHAQMDFAWNSHDSRIPLLA